MTDTDAETAGAIRALRQRIAALDADSLDLILRQARTHNAWQDRPVEDATLRRLHDLMKWGPTSGNCSPARIAFVKSPEAKEKLRPALMSGNVDKTMAAPVSAIIAYDPAFFDIMGEKLFAHSDLADVFRRNEQLGRTTAFRNGTLQGAYMIIAARALGLDCGPMSGFDNAKVDAAFFAESGYKSNFLCNLGYGDESVLHPRLPRLDFEEACAIL